MTGPSPVLSASMNAGIDKRRIIRNSWDQETGSSYRYIRGEKNIHFLTRASILILVTGTSAVNVHWQKSDMHLILKKAAQIKEQIPSVGMKS